MKTKLQIASHWRHSVVSGVHCLNVLGPSDESARQAPWTSPQAGPGRSRAWLGCLTSVLLMLHLLTTVDAADVRLIWESTGTGVLGGDQIGTTQTLNLVIEVGEEGLGAYQFEVWIEEPPIVLPTGVFTGSTPPPLVSTMPLTNDALVFRYFDGSPETPQPPQPPETLPGPASVVAGSFEVEVIDGGGVAVRPVSTGPLFDGALIPHILQPDQLHPAVIEEPPPPPPPHPALIALEHRFRIIASTEDPRYERLSLASLGTNGQVAFLAHPPDDPACNRECEAICITDGNTTTELLRNTGPFFELDYPVINAAGTLAFWAADGAQKPFPHMDQGLYLFDGQLREYLSVDADPAKIPNVGFQALGMFDVNDAGEIVFSSNYYDWFQDPGTGEWSSIPFDVIHYDNPETVPTDPVELYRAADPSVYSAPPAPYNDLGTVLMMNNARQVLFFAYTDGVFPDGKGVLLLGGVQGGLPVAPVVVASETSGEYEEILESLARLDNAGNVVFAAKPSGQDDWALYRWHDGVLTTILPVSHPAGITFHPQHGLATSSGCVVFGGSAPDFPNSLFFWTKALGLHRVFSAVSESELLDANDQPIRPSGVNRGPFFFQVHGVDEKGMVALNISWEDGVDTLVLATPTFTGLSGLRLDGTGFHMTLHGQPGQTLTVEATEDFVQWAVITNIVAGDVPIELNDPQAQGLDSRFYRVLQSE